MSVKHKRKRKQQQKTDRKEGKREKEQGREKGRERERTREERGRAREERERTRHRRKRKRHETSEEERRRKRSKRHRSRSPKLREDRADVLSSDDGVSSPASETHRHRYKKRSKKKHRRHRSGRGGVEEMEGRVRMRNELEVELSGDIREDGDGGDGGLPTGVAEGEHVPVAEVGSARSPGGEETRDMPAGRERTVPGMNLPASHTPEEKEEEGEMIAQSEKPSPPPVENAQEAPATLTGSAVQISLEDSRLLDDDIEHLPEDGSAGPSLEGKPSSLSDPLLAQEAGAGLSEAAPLDDLGEEVKEGGDGGEGVSGSEVGTEETRIAGQDGGGGEEEARGEEGGGVARGKGAAVMEEEEEEVEGEVDQVCVHTEETIDGDSADLDPEGPGRFTCCHTLMRAFTHSHNTCTRTQEVQVKVWRRESCLVTRTVREEMKKWAIHSLPQSMPLLPQSMPLLPQSMPLLARSSPN